MAVSEEGLEQLEQALHQAGTALQAPNYRIAAHLDFVDWNWSQPRCEESAQRVQLKERPAPYQYGQGKKNISDIMSDHSLSP